MCGLFPEGRVPRIGSPTPDLPLTLTLISTLHLHLLSAFAVNVTSGQPLWDMLLGMHYPGSSIGGDFLFIVGYEVSVVNPMGYLNVYDVFTGQCPLYLQSPLLTAGAFDLPVSSPDGALGLTVNNVQASSCAGMRCSSRSPSSLCTRTLQQATPVYVFCFFYCHRIGHGVPVVFM